MRLIKTYLLRLYADTDVSERICGDVQPLDEKQSYSRIPRRQISQIGEFG